MGVEATISVLTVAILHIVALVSPYYGWFMVGICIILCVFHLIKPFKKSHLSRRLHCAEL